MHASRRDIVAVSLAACGFGCISVLAKVAYEAGSEPPSLLSWRLLVAALALVPLVLGGLRALSRPAAGRGALGGCFFAAGGFLEFEGLARLPAATLVVILFLAPVWVAIWTRRLERTTAAWLAVVAVGTVLLVGAPGTTGVDAVGASLAVGASILYAGVFVLLEDLVRGVGPILAVALVLWPAAVIAQLVAPAAADPANPGYALAVGILTAGSLLLLAAGMRTTPAFAASVVTAAEPVAAAALAWVLLGELLSAVQIAGGLVVVAGVVGIARG